MAGRWIRQAFTYTGSPVTWTCPAGITCIFLRGVGGGGGGGRGGPGFSGFTSRSSPGGGAGGGARETTIVVPVTPGVTYEIYIGDGGAGATGAVDGSAGEDTYFKVSGAGTGLDLARFIGARGGRSPTSSDFNANFQGGESMRFDSSFWNWFDPMPGRGGFGGFSGDGDTRGAGGASHHGGAQTANNGGFHGSTMGSYLGGGGGGGGGHGASVSSGGQGGDGGGGNSGGTASNGTAGSDGSVGGGGGGGGGAGASSSGTATPGSGGKGGSGRLVLEWVE